MDLSARVGDRITIDGAKYEVIPTPTFRESELRRCWCCTPTRHTIISFDPSGREQYTCPNSRQTARYSDGASRVPGEPGRIVPTYMIGSERVR